MPRTARTPEHIARVSAALDNELDPGEQRALERDMRRDGVLSEHHRRLLETKELVQRHAPREVAPAALIKIVASLGPQTRYQMPPWLGRRLAGILASIFALAVILAVLTWLSPSY